MTDNQLAQAELKPCPFCGSDELSHGWDQPGWDGSEMTGNVECHNCRCFTLADTEDEAIAAWNTRATPDTAALIAQNRRLREALEAAIKALTDPRGLDDAICCSGHMCGCRGASHRDLLLHDLETMLARAAQEAKP